MESTTPLQGIQHKNVQSAENIEANTSSHPLRGAQEKESVIIIKSNAPQHEHLRTQRDNQADYEHLANSANSEMINVPSLPQAHSARLLSQLQPVTHGYQHPQKVENHQHLRSAKSHTQVIQPTFGTNDNRGQDRSSVGGWNGQL